MFRSRDSQGKPKYVGSSRAKVLDDRDPLTRGRILVDHPLLGFTSWIPYLTTPGNFCTPAVGDLVYVSCESGEPEYAYAWGNVTKGDKANPNIPAAFKRTVPTNRGTYTPGGHVIELDDGEAISNSDPKYTSRTTKGRGIRITSTSGHIIHINDDPDNQVQSITILDKEGDGVVFDAQTKQAVMVSKGKMSLTSDDTMSMTSNADLKISASTTADVKGSSGTNLGDGGSPTKVDGQTVTLAGGGPGIARLGDRAFGIGNLGAPVSSTIIQGSTKVTSG